MGSDAPFLLWTERPVLIAREFETHAWMESHRPWEVHGLQLVHDTSPGGWMRYSEVFRDVWRRAKDVGFINQESDVVPTDEAYCQLLSCPELVCTVPYVIYPYKTGGAPVGYSAVIERQIPGGWDSHFATPTDDWAVSADLGLIRFHRRLTQALAPDTLPPLTSNAGCFLHTNLWGWLSVVFPAERLRRVHLHWPGLRNNHEMWDEGDDQHHPGWRRDP